MRGRAEMPPPPTSNRSPKCLVHQNQSGARRFSTSHSHPSLNKFLLICGSLRPAAACPGLLVDLEIAFAHCLAGKTPKKLLLCICGALFGKLRLGECVSNCCRQCAEILWRHKPPILAVTQCAGDFAN